MPAHKGSPGLEELYPKIKQSYHNYFGSKATIPSEAWSFFHELHLLQSARDDDEIKDVVWALGVYAAEEKQADSRQGLDLATTFITALPTKEHEAWYLLSHREGNLDTILNGFPDQQSRLRHQARVVKTAAVIGIAILDFRMRWQKLLPWQRDFMANDLCAHRSVMPALFKEAQEVTNTMREGCFGFLFAKHLVRAGNSALALKLVCRIPAESLAGVVEYASPLEEEYGVILEGPVQTHSYYELYTRFLVQGGADAAAGFLQHIVRIQAYTDEALITLCHNEDLSDVVEFVISLVSEVRRAAGGRGAKVSGGKRCCPLMFWRKAPGTVRSSAMLLKTSNIPNVLLWELLKKYEDQDSSGRDMLLHDRAFQQALEVVLLLYESDLVVRGIERLSDSHQECLRKALQEWARLHLLRILDQNRPPSYQANSPTVQSIVKKHDLWVWTASAKRSHYFKSDMRHSEDLALVLWLFFEVSMFLDPKIIRNFIMEAQTRRPPVDVLSMYIPRDSQLFDVLAGGVSKRSPNLDRSEVKLLMHYPGFYEAGIQEYLKNGALEKPRAVFHQGLAFARLMQVVSRLFSFRDGPMDRQALESSLGQISSACHGDKTCSLLMGEVMRAALEKQDRDFLPDGAEDVHSDPSAFSVAGLASCARRLRVACDTIRNQPVELTFGKVVGAFLDTPPKGWVPLFNSLETVLFFLRFVEREDLKLAYEKFEAENKAAFSSGSEMKKLLREAKDFYTEPFINMQEDATDLCNLNVREKLCQKKLGRKHRHNRFSNDEWNIVVDIAACAAESMKEKYNVPMLPHHTQMITLLMLAIQVCNGPGQVALPRTILSKVGTGEGKSWIIGMLAAFVARKGWRAHVVIDNETLLARDYATMSALFQKMNINAGKGVLDQGHQVVYCSAIDIEMHFMEKMKAGTKDMRFKAVMIVDEVDSLIVDEGAYQSYVDDLYEGSEVVEWWWQEGRHSMDAFDMEPWKMKIVRMCEDAWQERTFKTEGRHYIVDELSGMIWALDERTASIKRSAWYLWLELLRKEKFGNYRIRYMTRQNVICKKSCFASYSFIFGLTGSLGTDAEQAYTKKHFNASCFMVPPFLDTCRGTGRPRPKCIQTRLEGNGQKQLSYTVQLVQKYCMDVPILVVVRDADRIRKVAESLTRALSSHAIGDGLGPGIIELVDRPGKEAEFQQMVEVATQPLEVMSKTGTKSRHWRITITTAIGARGQDYHISDEVVDEKGGFLVVLEYVPDSEREWIQFLGRTARHDHPGQYAVVLDMEEYRSVDFGSSGPDPATAVKQILDHMNKKNEQNLAEQEDQLTKGMLMHTYTANFWSWMKSNKGDKKVAQDKMGKWVDLCETFEAKDPEDIKLAFEALNIPLSVVESSNGRTSASDGEAPDAGAPIAQGSYTGAFSDDGLRHGEGSCTFDDGRKYVGQWVKGRMHGDGRMMYPAGSVTKAYKGQFEDNKRSGTGYVQWADGSSYKGQWLKGTQHGRGVYINPEGLEWKGEWRSGWKMDKSNASSNTSRERPSESTSSSSHDRAKDRNRERRHSKHPPKATNIEELDLTGLGFSAGKRVNEIAI